MMTDIRADEAIEINIRHDGKMVWINIDGICRLRVSTMVEGIIEIEDNRKQENENPNQLKINFEKVAEGRNTDG